MALRRDWLRRQPELRRFTLRLGLRVVLGVVTGGAAAVMTLWLDRRAQLTLPLPASNSQLLLGTLVGAILTIAVFAVWMRTVVVGLASSQASPRVLTGYLDDGFQRNLTAWMMASFAYLAAVTAALPTHSDGVEGVPAISSLLSVVVVLAAFSAVLVAIHSATVSLSMPQVIRTLADQALAVLDRQHAPDDAPPTAGSGEAKTMLSAPKMGWLQAIDHPRIMAQLSAGATLTISVNASEFIAEGDRVARADVELGADAAAQVLEAFTIVPTRASEYDLAYAIQQLADIAEHAMTPTSLDTSTAHEALVHLRAVLDRLLLRGTATGSLAGSDDRWIIAESAWRPADHLSVVFQRLVTAGSQDPTTAGELGSALRMVQRTAADVEDATSHRVVSQQLARLGRLANEVPATDAEDSSAAPRPHEVIRARRRA